MAFSIRNIFQPGTASDGKAQPGGGGGENPFAMYSTNAGTAPAPNSPPASPFGAAIFRAREDEPSAPPPMNGWGSPPPSAQGTPFSPFGAASSPVLTVGDILPQLPPEAVRANGAQPDQQVSVSPQVLEAALSSGSLAVPLFEIYRVCPALFQVPVSPQDPRMVQLPHHKLSSLVASQHGSSEAAPAAGASPFAASPALGSPFTPPTGSNNGASPFASFSPSAAEPQPMMSSSGTRPVGALPPKRPPGVPPAQPAAGEFAAQGASPFAASAPTSREALGSPFQPPTTLPQPPAASGNPFAASAFAGAGAAAGGLPSSPMGSPFGSPPPMPQDRSAQFDSDPEVGSPSQLLFGTKLGPAPSDGSAPPSPAASPFASAPLGMPPMPAIPAQPGESPFASSGNPFAPAAAPASNPFAMAAEPPASASPFSAAPAQAMPPAAFGSPFGSAPANPPAQIGASFEPSSRPLPSQQPALGSLPSKPMPAANSEQRPAFPSFPPFGGQAAPAPSGADELIEVRLSTLLQGRQPHELGFDPNFVPAWINAKLPASLFSQQLPTGKVSIDLGQIIDGTEATFKNVIAHGRREFKVELRAEDIAHAVPQFAHLVPAKDSAPSAAPSAAAPAPVATNPFLPAANSASGSSNPFSPAAPAGNPEPAAPASRSPIQPLISSGFDPFAPIPSQPANNTPPQVSESPQPPTSIEPPAPQQATSNPFTAMPQADAMWKPASAPANFPFTPAASHEPQHQAAAPASVSLLSALPEMPVTLPGKPTTAALPPQHATPSAAEPSSLFQVSGAAFLADVPGTSLSSPAKSTPLARQPTSQPREFASGSTASHPLISLSGGSTNPDQMLLRALLGVSEPLTPSRVVELTSELPGVLACSLVREGKLVAHAGSSPAAGEFEQQAISLAQNLKPLAALIGIQGAETFSITTDERLITFSFQPQSALGILHDGKESRTGLRDKITLISREVDRMS